MTRLNKLTIKSALTVAIVAASASLAAAASATGAPGGNNYGGPSAGAGDNVFSYSDNGRYQTCRGGHCDGQYGEVCFYTASHFGGSHFCTTPGTTNPQLSKVWNDRISSVKVIGMASAKLCSGDRLSGKCVLIRSNRTVLNSLDDTISSFAVR